MKTLLILLVSTVALVGCSSAEESAGNGTYAPPSKAEVDKQIAEIDANPNMPPQAKAMAKARLTANGTGQTSQGGK